MIKKVQDIYPSSKASPEEIKEYGWRFIEELPISDFRLGVDRTRSVAVAKEVSDYLRGLRTIIDEVDTLQLGTEKGVVEIVDFAVARIETATEPQLGFFALLPR